MQWEITGYEAQLNVCVQKTQIAVEERTVSLPQSVKMVGAALNRMCIILGSEATGMVPHTRL